MSGVYGVAAALTKCTERVSMFGFSASGIQQSRRYHYFDHCDHDPRADTLSQSAAVISGIVRAYRSIQMHASEGHPMWQMNAPFAGPCPRYTDNAKLALLLKHGVHMGRQPVPTAGVIADSLVAGSSPFMVLHGYWNRSKAEATRAEVSQAIEQCSEAGEGKDRRRMGITSPKNFPLMQSFQNDPFLLEIAKRHQRKAVNVRAQAGVTLPGEASGGGWHKDTMARGLKAMMYLDDVDETNGPFAMLINYRDKHLRFSPDAVSGIFRRLNNSVIDDYLLQNSNARVDTLHASMGSVIVFEISSVHRGMPCNERPRVSLTNYYKVKKAPTTCNAGTSLAKSEFLRVGRQRREKTA